MGFRDYVVEQAAAREDRAYALTEKQDAWRSDRERDLLQLLADRPLLATVPGCYSTEKMPPAAVEMVAWVLEHSAEPERALAEAIYSTAARDRMHRTWVAAQAERECDAMPESAWSDE